MDVEIPKYTTKNDDIPSIQDMVYKYTYIQLVNDIIEYMKTYHYFFI
jgi:hypothetical protein